MIVPIPPSPPAAYSPPDPTDSVVVSYAELAEEVALPGPRTIVVAAGVYSGEALTTNQGHDIWAETQGSVVFQFGIGFRGNSGNSGGSLHGISFDVDNIANVDSTALYNEAIVNTWDSVEPYTVGSDLLIEDCTFDGNNVIGTGVQAANPGGLTIRRSTFANFLDNGILAYKNGTGPGDLDTITLEDISIDGVSRAVPGEGSGFIVETGIVLGHTFSVSRVKIRNCAWSGIGLVNGVQDWLITDFDIDKVGHGYRDPGGVGIYCEHCSNGTITRGVVGPESMIGINFEWNQGDANPFENDLVPRNYGVTVSYTTLQSYKIGVHMDLGVSSVSISDSQFERAWKAGVLDNNTFPDDAGNYAVPVGEEVVLSTNTLDQDSSTFLLQKGVPRLFHGHHGGASAEPPSYWPTDPSGYVYVGPWRPRKTFRLFRNVAKDTIEVSD